MRAALLKEKGVEQVNGTKRDGWSYNGEQTTISMFWGISNSFVLIS